MEHPPWRRTATHHAHVRQVSSVAARADQPHHRHTLAPFQKGLPASRPSSQTPRPPSTPCFSDAACVKYLWPPDEQPDDASPCHGVPPCPSSSTSSIRSARSTSTPPATRSASSPPS